MTLRLVGLFAMRLNRLTPWCSLGTLERWNRATLIAGVLDGSATLVA